MQALTVSHEDVHFQAKGGESCKGGTPTAKEEDDRVGDRCKGPGSVTGSGGHDGRAATEEAGGSVTAAGELATGTAGGNSHYH